LMVLLLLALPIQSLESLPHVFSIRPKKQRTSAVCSKE
jgi:hypothetical protein